MSSYLDFTGLQEYNNKIKTAVRAVYRGKNLGTSIDSGQVSAIANGTFEDLYVGDYWTLNGKKFIIADFDYWYGCPYDNFDKHHIVLTTDQPVSTMSMSSGNNANYVNSQIHNYLNNSAFYGEIDTLFGALSILSHAQLLENGPAAYKWTAGCKIEIPNSNMMLGYKIQAATTTTPSPADIIGPYDSRQLDIFNLHKSDINLGSYGVWLRDSVNSGLQAIVNQLGAPSVQIAGSSCGILPVFAVGMA